MLLSVDPLGEMREGWIKGGLLGKIGSDRKRERPKVNDQNTYSVDIGQETLKKH